MIALALLSAKGKFYVDAGAAYAFSVSPKADVKYSIKDDGDTKSREETKSRKLGKGGVLGLINAGYSMNLGGVTWNNELGVNFGSVKNKFTSDKTDLVKGGIDGEIKAHQIVLKRGMGLRLTSALELETHACLKPFIGASLLFTQFSSTYNVDKTPGAKKYDESIKDAEAKKFTVGFGPIVGVRFELTKQVSAKLFAQYEMYSKLKTKEFDQNKQDDRTETTKAFIKPRNLIVGLAASYTF